MADLLIGGFLLYAAWYGWRTGLVRGIVSLLGVVVAYLLAKSFYSVLVPFVAKFVSISSWRADSNETLQTVVAFVILFVLIFLAIKLTGYLLHRLAKVPVLNQLNHGGGLLIGLVIAVFVAALACNVLRHVPNGDLQTALRESKVRAYVLDPVQQLMPLK